MERSKRDTQLNIARNAPKDMSRDAGEPLGWHIVAVSEVITSQCRELFVIDRIRALLMGWFVCAPATISGNLYDLVPIIAIQHYLGGT